MKGVSTIIATVLLLAITVLISLVVSTSFTQITKEQTSTVSTRTTQAVNCTSSDINVEAVYLDTGPSNQSRVTVRNSGQINENIVAAKMYNKTGIEAASITTYPAAIAKGSLTTLLFNISGSGGLNVTCSSFSQVIVSTECVTEVFDSTPKNC
ncbi:MAG: hypothetical protein HY368_00700 [Candidatus Aenigmarchaeota archaeon]|nr:hypothetical protein [Candidatus Aenigmarchaeota archaeon]